MQQQYRHIRNYYLSNSKTFQDGNSNGNFLKINSNDLQDGNFDTEYDRAKVPPHNGNDPPPATGSLKALLSPSLLNNVNKGMQGV